MSSSFYSANIPEYPAQSRVSFNEMNNFPGVYRIFDKTKRDFVDGRMVVFHSALVEINVTYVSNSGFNPRHKAWERGWENGDYTFVLTNERLVVSFVENK